MGFDVVMGEPTSPRFTEVAYPALERDSGRWTKAKERVIQIATPRRPSWIKKVALRFAELDELEPNWDGRGARALSLEDADDAIRFLVSAMTDSSPLPSITPLPSGGLELSWEEADVELEVIFDRAHSERVALISVDGNDEEVQPERAITLVGFLGEQS